MWNRCEAVCHGVSLREAWYGPPESAVGLCYELVQGS